jgi:hypothetical protein
MIKDMNSMNHLFKLVDHLLKKGGVFAFTCLDGNLLKDRTVSLSENNVLKYSIIPTFKNDEITLCRSKILLPFSDQQYYEENLVDISKIINLFTSKKYKLLDSKYFSDCFDKIEASKDLSAVDKEYDTYWKYTILQKGQ